MHAIQPQADASASSLRLNGNCAYRIDNDRVVIEIAQIANQRDSGDISGTVAVELWALKQPYNGGDFNGTGLAATTIGELFGQHYLANCRYDLQFTEPPIGTWYLALMLREWTENGYVTRDCVNFALPYVVAAKAVVRSETDNVINVSFTNGDKTSLKAVAEKAKTVAETGRKQDDAAVSLNSAALQDIAAVKGISKKLAENIIAARPFSSLEEVLKVRGMGAKLLQKLRKFITL